mmetsp:Transcript_11539/g.32018  ORF Transcript_11539/g.32018 Transcript_11539/m.32018 type:complete len:297 (-) Transcript_11539:6-896(-)
MRTEPFEATPERKDYTGLPSSTSMSQASSSLMLSNDSGATSGQSSLSSVMPAPVLAPNPMNFFTSCTLALTSAASASALLLSWASKVSPIQASTPSSANRSALLSTSLANALAPLSLACPPLAAAAVAVLVLATLLPEASPLPELLPVASLAPLSLSPAPGVVVVVLFLALRPPVPLKEDEGVLLVMFPSALLCLVPPSPDEGVFAPLSVLSGVFAKPPLLLLLLRTRLLLLLLLFCFFRPRRPGCCWFRFSLSTAPPCRWFKCPPCDNILLLSSSPRPSCLVCRVSCVSSVVFLF